LFAVVDSDHPWELEPADDVLPEEFLIVSDVMLMSGLASIHFVKYSTATAAYL
jgi:hypothetical protein